mgnify:CR=1 FL=1
MAVKSKRSESRCRYYIREQALKRGWNTYHPRQAGDFLEEQEIINHFPDINLGQDRPDFLITIGGTPTVVVEAKNESHKVDIAVAEAIEYAEKINLSERHKIYIAVGAAGDESTGFSVKVKFLKGNTWIPLTSKGFEITTIPSKREVETALMARDGSTSVEVPSIAEFIDAAIELSSILRTAKVEAPLRPKVIGALTLAMYQGEINFSQDNVLDSINSLIETAINESVDLDPTKKINLFESLRLQGVDYQRLNNHILRIVRLMKSLNIKAVLQTDTDFLGLFYEAFLRYGYDNNALGIVFTPRHITRFSAQLINTDSTDVVVDLACGTGGFLVAAFDQMMDRAHGPKAILKVKKSLYGFDTNPTIWALATLNMFFRGDGKSHIFNESCLEPHSKEIVYEKCTKAFLNPPFSQENEPERDFIDASMEALIPEGLLVCVVKAGIFADEENSHWREEFQRNHTVLGMISLPEDLFYPTAAPTSILIAKAHIPQSVEQDIFISRVWNDGFTKLKGRRVDCDGSQLEEVLDCFNKFKINHDFSSHICQTIKAEMLMNGEEWSPQKWLDQPHLSTAELAQSIKEINLSLYRAVTAIPDLADQAISDFSNQWDDLPPLEYGKEENISYFFRVLNGKSSGEKNYLEGETAYISSGDSLNSIIRLVKSEDEEIFPTGGITVTAFGQAYVQPWSFMARGNGGSSVRVLIPKFKMNFKELCWFAAQINNQKWRIFYARMAIKSRLEKTMVFAPDTALIENLDSDDIAKKLNIFRNHLLDLSE